jgi:NADH-quinone oxidoreductase subunit D
MLHEPEYFAVTLEGEKIIDIDMHLGYNHRGVEKLAASKANIYQSLELINRTCGICSEAHSCCFSRGVEKILNLQIPDRARYIRTIMSELNRIQSHLLWLGSFAYEIGFETLFMHMWADRSIIVDLLERISGNRIHYTTNTIGGVRRDISNEMIDRIKRNLRVLKERFKVKKEIFRTDSTINKRVENVGKLSKRKAEELGVVGPTARASGISIDVRKDSPYNAYMDLDFKVVTEKKCDAKARMNVRIEEVFESIDMILQALDRMPKGKINTGKKYFSLKEGETVSVVEAPRGENLHFIKTSRKKLERIRIRPPTYANLFALKEMLKGSCLADIPPVLSSIDPCFSCTDRIVVIDIDKQEKRVVNMNELWSDEDS